MFCSHSSPTYPSMTFDFLSVYWTASVSSSVSFLWAPYNGPQSEGKDLVLFQHGDEEGDFRRLPQGLLESCIRIFSFPILVVAVARQIEVKAVLPLNTCHSSWARAEDALLVLYGAMSAEMGGIDAVHVYENPGYLSALHVHGLRDMETDQNERFQSSSCTDRVGPYTLRRWTPKS
jgi:hypothetical protein